ncbi:MAG: right-handed parallel beta-helix repeat-containing protein, partial [Candidatus Burarchaeum sp.]
MSGKNEIAFSPARPLFAIPIALGLLLLLSLIPTASAVIMINSCDFAASTAYETYVVAAPTMACLGTNGVNVLANGITIDFNNSGFSLAVTGGTEAGVFIASGVVNTTIMGNQSAAAIHLTGFPSNIWANTTSNVSIWNMTMRSKAPTNNQISMNSTHRFEIKNTTFVDAPPRQMYIQGSDDGVIENFTSPAGTSRLALVANSTFVRFSNFTHQRATTTTLFDIQDSNYTTFTSFTLGNTSAGLIAQDAASTYIILQGSRWSNITSSAFANASKAAILVNQSNHSLLFNLTFWNNSGSSLLVDGIAASAENNTFSNLTIRDSATGTGIMVQGQLAKNNTILNSTIANVSIGIELSGGGN